MDLCSAFQKAAAEGRMINSRMTRVSLPRSADPDFDSYVDCSTTITTAVHLRSYVYTHPSNRCALNFRTPTDIFPNIDIPVVSIISSFNGMVAKDGRHERIHLTLKKKPPN